MSDRLMKMLIPNPKWRAKEPRYLKALANRIKRPELATLHRSSVRNKAT